MTSYHDIIRHLVELKPKIAELKEKLKGNTRNFADIITYNGHRVVDRHTISIAMTTHNRKKQLLHTLGTIEKSTINDIQVVIVDDSTEKGLCAEDLKDISYRIDYVKICPEKKCWMNPCVNYNMAFDMCVGDKIIIQNSEVCHIGDIASYVKNNLGKNQYLVFDVMASPSFDQNEVIYSSSGKYEEIKKLAKKYTWYQHYEKRNSFYHFLTAICKQDLQKIGGFDYDFSLGSACDDVELVLRIKNVFKLNIINVKNDDNCVCGIHLRHLSNSLHVKFNRFLNRCLITVKRRYFHENNVWIYLNEFGDQELTDIITWAYTN